MKTEEHLFNIIVSNCIKKKLIELMSLIPWSYSMGGLSKLPGL
jgi:hypothetical protein